jgi:hypothetical protein
MSRIQLAQFFKQQAFEQVGVSPQRMAQPIGQKVSATEVEQIQAGSYAQTEMHFVEHCDHLMPRIHQMRTDLAQYYHSHKPSIRLQFMIADDERTNFEINGDDLMLRDINVFCTTKANHRKLLEDIKRLAFENNTTGASIYDLGSLAQADSVGTLNSVLKKIEAKTQKQKQEEYAQAQQLKQMELEQAEKEKAMELEHEVMENEKNRRRDILVAEIRASGYGAMMDINQNKESDFVDNMTKIQKTEQYQETVDIQERKRTDNQLNQSEKMNLKREELAMKRDLKNLDLIIARENKNRYDMAGKVEKKPENKSKKK